MQSDGTRINLEAAISGAESRRGLIVVTNSGGKKKRKKKETLKRLQR